MTIDVQNSDVFTFTITGAQLATIFQALGELQHKVSAPLETLFIEQVRQQKTPATLPKPWAPYEVGPPAVDGNIATYLQE